VASAFRRKSALPTAFRLKAEATSYQINGLRDEQESIVTADRPRVLVTRRIPSSALAKLEAVCDTDVHNSQSPLAHDELKARLRDKAGLVCVYTDRIDRDLLLAAPQLKVISTIAVGVDNIDVAAAKERGIIVTNTPDVVTEATAELTWGLILAATRRIGEGDRLVRRKGWKAWTLEFMLGAELRGKQLGIIGRGRIGKAVAAKAPAFGMTAVFARQDMSLDELLISSDVISIHTSLRDDTQHLIDRLAFARMKRSAIFVNSARGAIVDEEALVWALKERLIAAAALDVYEHEPHVHEALLDLENVVLSPHLGSATRETRTAMIDLAVRNTIEVLQGRAALSPV
jgi:glyoxylate reductase